jgi:hypothetical protein
VEKRARLLKVLAGTVKLSSNQRINMVEAGGVGIFVFIENT